MTRTMMTTMAALMLSAVPPAAQDFDDDGYNPPEYGEQRFERRRFRRLGAGQGGSICVTARGNCVVPPAPYNAPCGCVIPGFGPKRGQIGG